MLQIALRILFMIFQSQWCLQIHALSDIYLSTHVHKYYHTKMNESQLKKYRKEVRLSKITRPTPSACSCICAHHSSGMLLWRLKVLLSSKPLKDTRKLFEGFKRQTLDTEMCNLLLSSLFFDIQSCVAWQNKTTWSFFSSQYCSFVKVQWCQESLLPQYHRLELLALLEVPPLLQGDKPPVVEMSIRK